jgi:hypothetical protein
MPKNNKTLLSSFNRLIWSCLFLFCFKITTAQNVFVKENTKVAGFNQIHVENNPLSTTSLVKYNVNVLQNTIIVGLDNYQTIELETFISEHLCQIPNNQHTVFAKSLQNKQRKVLTKIKSTVVYSFNTNNSNCIKSYQLFSAIFLSHSSTTKKIWLSNVLACCNPTEILLNKLQQSKTRLSAPTTSTSNTTHTAFGNLPPPHLAV